MNTEFPTQETVRVPVWASRDMRQQKAYIKIDENWGFMEDTIFPLPFDANGDMSEKYTVWRGSSLLDPHPHGTVEPDPYTGELTYALFHDYDRALEFCLRVKAEYERRLETA